LDTQLFVGYDPGFNAIWVAFRGTDPLSIVNWSARTTVQHHFHVIHVTRSIKKLRTLRGRDRHAQSAADRENTHPRHGRMSDLNFTKGDYSYCSGCQVHSVRAQRCTGKPLYPRTDPSRQGFFDAYSMVSQKLLTVRPKSTCLPAWPENARPSGYGHHRRSAS
jgi:hypothetical protein